MNGTRRANITPGIRVQVVQALAPGKEARLGLVLSGTLGGWARGTKDYSAFQPIILQLVEAIVARRRCLLKYQAPNRDRPNNFRFDLPAALHPGPPVLRGPGAGA